MESTTTCRQDLVPVTLDQRTSDFLVTRNTDIEDLLHSFFSNKSPRTIEAYRKDLQDFRKFLRVETIDEAEPTLTAWVDVRSDQQDGTLII